MPSSFSLAVSLGVCVFYSVACPALFLLTNKQAASVVRGASMRAFALPRCRLCGLRQSRGLGDNFYVCSLSRSLIFLRFVGQFPLPASTEPVRLS